MQVPYGKSFHVELVWTACRLSDNATRLQVVGMFVQEKRMLGVGGIIRKATSEVIRAAAHAVHQHPFVNSGNYSPWSGGPPSSLGPEQS